MDTLLKELASYPILLQHEESLNKRGEAGMYDVSTWMVYFEEVDTLIEAMEEAAMNARKSIRSSKAFIKLGGREIAVPDLKKKGELLHRVRNLLSERALLILPGSYKLWKHYLDFRSQKFMTSHHDGEDDASVSSYPQMCSNRGSRYQSTISAYERSLIRMNKYPRIWLSYIAFVIRNDPSCDVTFVRHLFNRALMSLPATQHDLIWSEYLCYILGRVPPMGLFVSKSHSSSGSSKDGPVVTMCKMDIMSPVAFPLKVPKETTLHVLRRYARFYNPLARELWVEVAMEYERYGEAASILVEILNDSDFHSFQGASRHDLWMQLADLCTVHPEDVENCGIDFHAIVRAALYPIHEKKISNNSQAKVDQTAVSSSTESDIMTQSLQEDESEKLKRLKAEQEQLQASLGEMEGSLWAKLAQYYIAKGDFDMARSTYEEAMERVSRVRDFSLIFDAYVRFEEGVVEALVELMGDVENTFEESTDSSAPKGTSDQYDDKIDWNIILGGSSNLQQSDTSNLEGGNSVEVEVELALARAENLMNRRPLLLNRVLLRQNQNNVAEWLKRVDLFIKSNELNRAIRTLDEAVKNVNARYAVNGSPSSLYIRLAGLHEMELKDVDGARAVFKRVCCPTPEYNFLEMDDLARCFSSWVEMELRTEHWVEALSAARQFSANSFMKSSSKPVRILNRSVRLWNLLLDLEESLGTLQTTKDAYNRAIELKVVTPLHILNFASYLNEHKYFEDSFSAFERGIELFPFPHEGGRLIWKQYLESFQNRYGGAKISRMRELFDRCLEACPAETAAEFYLLNGAFEEEHGLTKRALGVYERMCTVVQSDEKFIAYKIYIMKTIKYLGTTASRSLYEQAIAALEDTYAADMCCDFAKMEASLQEIDRARAAFTYGSQMADPRRKPEYWKDWHEFEVINGIEETFREMLRIKRSVQAAFSTVNYNAADIGAVSPAVQHLTDEEALQMIASREGIDTDDIRRIQGFVHSKRTSDIKNLEEVENRAAKLRKVSAATNADPDTEEINIDDDVSDNFVQDVMTKPVPSSVFGSLSSAIKGN